MVMICGMTHNTSYVRTKERTTEKVLSPLASTPVGQLMKYNATTKSVTRGNAIQTATIVLDVARKDTELSALFELPTISRLLVQLFLNKYTLT